MNPLGYINLYWLHEVLDDAIYTSDDWYVRTYPEKADFEQDSYVLAPYRGNCRSLLLFLEHGLRPSHVSLNEFQRTLVLDCFALLVARNDRILWETVNYFDTLMGMRTVIAEDPNELFTELFDTLSTGYTSELASYSSIQTYKYDSNDRLDTYKYC